MKVRERMETNDWGAILKQQFDPGFHEGYDMYYVLR